MLKTNRAPLPQGLVNLFILECLFLLTALLLGYRLHGTDTVTVTAATTQIKAILFITIACLLYFVPNNSDKFRGLCLAIIYAALGMLLINISLPGLAAGYTGLVTLFVCSSLGLLISKRLTPVGAA